MLQLIKVYVTCQMLMKLIVSLLTFYDQIYEAILAYNVVYSTSVFHNFQWQTRQNFVSETEFTLDSFIFNDRLHVFGSFSHFTKFLVEYECRIEITIIPTLVSVSSTFYAHIFLYKILAPKITKPNVTREKLPKRLTYKKGVCKMLMKLTPCS